MVLDLLEILEHVESVVHLFSSYVRDQKSGAWVAFGSIHVRKQKLAEPVGFSNASVVFQLCR
jgi:hypothetical protein